MESKTCSKCGRALIDKDTGLLLTTIEFKDGRQLCFICFRDLPDGEEF